ncbi:MAG: S24/S26 family peptidase [Acidobacteriota bacterium]|nr:S24/S26 family peptidase [Acidobacteriota bacterium]
MGVRPGRVSRVWKVGWKLLAAVLFALVGVAAWSLAATNHAYVTTPSMYPTIPPGSMVFIRPERSYHVGQVIEFRGNGLDFVHRIVRISPAGAITTKGDNPQNVPDVFVPSTTTADVIGAVYAAPRWVGFPELIVHHPSYGIAWLRAELGRPGEAAVVIVAGLLTFLAYGGGRRSAPKHRIGAAARSVA